VLNFFGPRAFALPGKNDGEAADWLVDHHGELAAILEKNGGPFVTALACEELARDSTLSAEDIRHLIGSGAIPQISNDLKRYEQGPGAISDIQRFVLDESGIDGDSQLLDIGCSCGRHLLELASRQPQFVVGADTHLLAVAAGARAWREHVASPQVHWCCASVLELPFRERSFTHVHCIGTLSLVPIRRGLREIARVLMPGGRALITVEGPGFRRFCRDNGTGRLTLLRWWLGSKLQQYGLDWQRFAWTRRLSGLTQYSPTTFRRLAASAGLNVEHCHVLRSYAGQPSLLGFLARATQG
jgi:SAM-dependent methyltransferase